MVVFKMFTSPKASIVALIRYHNLKNSVQERSHYLKLSFKLRNLPLPLTVGFPIFKPTIVECVTFFTAMVADSLNLPLNFSLGLYLAQTIATCPTNPLVEAEASAGPIF